MRKQVPFSENLCSNTTPKMLSIKINNRCNCNCSFCIDREGYNADKIDVKAIAKSAIAKSSFKKVIITGGEPFLNFDSVIELLKLLRPHKERIILNTNGTLLTSDKVNSLNGLIDELQISIHHFNEVKNDAIFGCHVSFENIREALIGKQFSVSINSTFNNSFSEEDKQVAIDKMIELSGRISAKKLRLTELKKVDNDDFVCANGFLTDESIILSYNATELFTKGCSFQFSKKGILVSVKRLCEFAKGKDSRYFACGGDGYPPRPTPGCGNPFGKHTTFKVIYSNGLTTDNWLLNKAI